MSTLIIGARCSDGVVLAADRRELRGYEPSERCKIRRIEVEGKPAKSAILLAGAGVAAFWDEVAWSVEQNVKTGSESNIDTLLDAVDRISALSINMSARYQRDGLDERLGCVVGGLEHITTGKAGLYYFAGAGFSKAEFICLGSGGSYALPMADLLLHQKNFTTCQAMQVIPFLFLLVERVNVSVGQGPDIFILKDGEQATQMSNGQVGDARMRASRLLEALPETFLKVVENPEVLRELP